MRLSGCEGSTWPTTSGKLDEQGQQSAQGSSILSNEHGLPPPSRLIRPNG